MIAKGSLDKDLDKKTIKYSFSILKLDPGYQKKHKLGILMVSLLISIALALIVLWEMLMIGSTFSCNGHRNNYVSYSKNP